MNEKRNKENGSKSKKDTKSKSMRHVLKLIQNKTKIGQNSKNNISSRPVKQLIPTYTPQIKERFGMLSSSSST